MPRPFHFPAYPKKKHATGQARIRFRGRSYYLGIFDSPASRLEYARLAQEFAVNPGRAFPPKPGPSTLTVAELVVLWYEDQIAGNETEQCLMASRPLVRLFGATLAADFDAEALGSLRTAMVSCSWMNDEELADREKRKKALGWSRNHVRHQVTRIRKIFRWAEQKKKVPKGTWEHLRCLSPLKKGLARNNPRRKPVEEEVVEATIPHLSPMVAAMVRVQLAAGMRPSELVDMRVSEINRSKEVWTYQLDEYKTDYLDDADDWQTVMLGPAAKLALTPWLDAAAALGPDTFIWRPKPGLASHLSTDGYYQAIVDGCKRAGVKRFCPYQLRHSCKRRVERIAGEQGARAVLRQRTVQSTRQYSDQQDLLVAEEVAKKCG